MNSAIPWGWSVTVELFRVVLSWPVAVIVIGITAMWVFRDGINDFLRKVQRVKFPGGEVQSLQEEPGIRVPDEYLVLNPTQQQRLSDAISAELKSTERRAQEEKQLLLQQAQAAVNSLQQQATFWEFSYLAYYLVPNSKRTLSWIGSVPNNMIELDTFHTILKRAVDSQSERQAILNALQQHQLVAISNNTVSITEKGREFLKVAGIQ